MQQSISQWLLPTRGYISVHLSKQEDRDAEPRIHWPKTPLHITRIRLYWIRVSWYRPSFRKTKQFGNCSKNSFDGCFAQMTHFPMASAWKTNLEKNGENGNIQLSDLDNRSTEYFAQRRIYKYFILLQLRMIFWTIKAGLVSRDLWRKIY